MLAAVFSHILRRDRAAARALALLVALAAVPAFGQTKGTWNVDANGTWSVSSNWLNNAIGGGNTGIANFTNDITATRTVTLDTNRNIGALVFGDADTATAASWIVTTATGNTLTFNNGTGTNSTITVNDLGAEQTATISLVLGGAIATVPAIIKNGVGTLVLSNTGNTFTSKLQITEGTLQVSADRNLGNTGSFATDRITLSDGATLRTTAAFTMNANRGITVSSGTGTLSVNGGTLTSAAPVTGAGNTLRVTGANPLSLQNANAGTDVNWDFASNNSVRNFFRGPNALGTGSVTVRNGVRLTSESTTTGTIANAVTLDSGAGLSARSTGGQATYSSVALPSSGSVKFNVEDQATSQLNINLASGIKELTGNLTVETAQSSANAIGNVLLFGEFSGAGGLTKTGTAGLLILRGSNSYAGNTVINSGTLQLGTGGALSPSSTITGAAGATLAFNRSDTITSGVDFNSAIGGGINLAQVGSGTVVLTAANTIGKTSITAGVLQISAADQLGAAPGSFTADQLTISNSATLRTTTGGMTLPAAHGITIGAGGGKIDANGTGGNLIVNGRFTGSGETVTVTGSTGIRLGNTANGASNVNWDFAMNNAQRAFFDGSDALGSGTVTVRSGIRLVSQTQAPTNGEVTNAVTLEDGAGLAARSTGGAVTYTNVALPSTGTLIFNQDDQATSALTIASGKELTGLLTINTSQGGASVSVGDVTLSGIFSGTSGALIKAGTGTSGRLILGGVNTYGGNTTISTGTLALGAAGSIANSATIILSAASTTFDVSAVTGGFSLGAAQALAGVGTVLGDVTALGTIAPGLSPGTLTFANNLSLDSGSILNYELSGTDMTVGGGINDLSSVLGDLTLDGTLNVTETVAGSFLSANVGDSWRIFDYSGTLLNNGFTLGIMPALSGGNSFQIDTSTANQVNLVVVPEPATIVTVMVGLGMLGVVAARRRLRSIDR